MLREQSQDAVKAIIEESAQGNNAPGSNEQKVGDLYNSYMDMATRNEVGTAPLMKIFAELDTLADHHELGAYFGRSIRAGFGAPFRFFINGDADDPTVYSVYTGQSGLGLRDREYYLKTDDKSVEIRAKYLDHVEKMLGLVGMENAGQNAAAIMALETKLATVMWKKEDSRDRIKTHNVLDRAALIDMMPDFDWVGYFAAVGMPDLEKMNISQPSYFQALNGIMGETDLATWRVYFKWLALNRMDGFLNEALDNQSFEFYAKTLRGVKAQEPQWKRAVGTVNGTLGEVIGEVYVARHFKPEAKERMQELVSNLSRAYANSIKKLDWMGEETKVKALEKLSLFTPKIGYPDKWKDYSALEIKGDDLFGNIMRSTQVTYQRNLEKLGGPIQRHLWGMNPQTVNAYYNPAMNEIVFPAAILQPPFFEMGIDEAVNYGAIGGVIGHEIGHGFDDQGSTYDGTGALKNWWTDTDKASFKERTDALVAQYNGFKVFDDLNVNGAYTLGENIGDLGGLSIAIKAYHLSLDGKPAPVINGMTAEQRLVRIGPPVFQALNGIMGETDLATWRVYFKWLALNRMDGFLNEALDNQSFEFYAKTLRGVKAQEPQWKRAVGTVNGTLGEVIGEVYVARHFKPEAKERMQELVSNLSRAYANSIKKLDWMGEETKVKALEKLSLFTPKIGYPDKWKDYSALEIKGDDLFGNIMRSTQVTYQRNLEKLGGPIQRHLWGMNPQTVNAYYNPAMNEIVFPAAILQPPFFEMGIDEAVNYGAIGGVIGHEIGHGFDDQGSTYDGTGALKNWWTDTDKASFKERTDALVAQYNGFKVFDDLNVNGAYTLGENIGDLGGLSIAIKAYHLSLDGKPAPVINGMTAEQRIFIGWAQAFMGTRREASARQQVATDPHSPARFRVNGVVRNIPAFYEAFDVKPDDALYLTPEDRVKIW